MTLSQAPHAAVDGLPVDAGTFDAVAARAERRRRVGLAGGTALVMAAGVGVGFGAGFQVGRNGATPGVGTPVASPSVTRYLGSGAAY
jgi:hypothetical protein